jgi:acetyltransferase
LPPLNSALAARTINATKIAKALKGLLEFKAVAQELVETLLIRVSRLVTDFPQICELEINPVAVTDGQLMGRNALIRLAPPPAAAPDHLIISPYPAWQEQLYTTRESEQVLIRPVKPEDADAMLKFFEHLSTQTIYLRFFTPLKQLSKRMLIQLTQIDYDREVALVAWFPAHNGEKIIGTARIIFTANGTEGEFAIMLADSWQGKGIGAALLKSCLAFSKRYGLKRVFGLVLRENRQMLRLADKLGFKKVRAPASNEIELIIDIEKLDLYTL